MRSLRAAVLAMFAALWPTRTQAQLRPCEPRGSGPGPSRDLYCIELVPAPGVEHLTASVELSYVSTPFTVAVTRDGVPRYRPVFRPREFVAPSTLGNYTSYVAWAMTPDMRRTVKLGTVRGTPAILRDVDFEKFTLLVTAERDSSVVEPGGRIVLRAQSPSSRLQPPDILEFALGNMVEGAAKTEARAATATSSEAHAHNAPAVAGGSAQQWPSHPMHPSVQMLPAEMALLPGVAPYLPQANSNSRVPAAKPRQTVRLKSGDTLRLEAGLVTRTWKGTPYVMYGFNGQTTGPLLSVDKDAQVVVEFTNALDQPTTVHWHGLRLENQFDGIPDLTQRPVPPGGHFTYRLRFPDAGIYWYHPHVREDIQQDLGLYGNLRVHSPRADYYSPAHREEVLLLDDVLVGSDGLVPWGKESTTHAFMGRFGNLFLVNGEPNWRTTAKRGEVVRFFFTNVSNTRTLNLSFGNGARMKVVGSDVGNFENEAWVQSVVIAPAERYVVHVQFDDPGQAALVNRVRGLDHLYGRFFQEEDTLGVVQVGDAPASPNYSASFASTRSDTAVISDIARYRQHFNRAVDRELVLALRTRNLPFITRSLMELDSIYFAPVEWSGTMPHMNWASTADQVTWLVRDTRTGKENMAIDDWKFTVGDVVKVRLSNERASFHAMQHPVHLHGQRFLVLNVNGVPQENHAWKDTVLLPVGTTVELLVEMSNPGRWMLHCHIAEHLSADMMMEFQVLAR